jgi:hypothetical protein
VSEFLRETLQDAMVPLKADKVAGVRLWTEPKRGR